MTKEVSIKTYTNRSEAENAAKLLQEKGVEVKFAVDDLRAFGHSKATTPFGNTRILVREEAKDKAMRILEGEAYIPIKKSSFTNIIGSVAESILLGFIVWFIGSIFAFGAAFTGSEYINPYFLAIFTSILVLAWKLLPRS